MIDADRHDRHRAALDDLLEPALERQEKAGPRDAALREDAHVATVVSGLKGRAGEYSAVEKAQFIFKRMLDEEIVHHGKLDAPTIIDKLMVML